MKVRVTGALTWACWWLGCDVTVCGFCTSFGVLCSSGVGPALPALPALLCAALPGLGAGQCSSAGRDGGGKEGGLCRDAVLSGGGSCAPWGLC